MSRKLGNLFFSTIKRAARLQKQALQQAGVSAARKSRKKAVKQGAGGKPAMPPVSMGKGLWQNLIHETAATRTELLGRLVYSLYRPGGHPAAGLPLLIMLHGARDRVVSVRNADQVARQFARLNQLGEGRESVLGKNTHREYLRRDFPKAGKPYLRLCVIRDLGHAWSGGNGNYRYHSDKGPSASVLIWQFLSLHHRASLDGS